MTAAKSPTVFNARMAAQLDRLYASAQVVAQRASFRELVAAQPGEIGVDVGCGLAHLACELAREVAPAGRIVGLDNSEHMVGEATARVAAQGLDQVITVRRCDASALDLADASVDFVVAAQVFSYVPDISRAIAEAARVLRFGGRLAVLETDWDLCIFESSDRVLSRRIVDARATQFAHPYLPRQLHRLFHAAGLRLANAAVFPIVETHYDADSFGASLIPIMRASAISRGIDAAVVDAWSADIQARTSDGEYFFCANRIMFVAVK